MRENIKVGRGSQTGFSTIAAIDSLELCRNAMGHHPSQAGLSDLWMRISAELPAHPGHFSSDAAAFGWLYGSSKLEKIILALGYNSWILMDNIEREPGPEEALVCLEARLVSLNISTGLIKNIASLYEPYDTYRVIYINTAGSQLVQITAALPIYGDRVFAPDRTNTDLFLSKHRSNKYISQCR